MYRNVICIWRILWRNFSVCIRYCLSHNKVCLNNRKPGGGKNIDGLFGKSKHFEAKHNYSSALDAVNQVIVHFPNFLPALVEKMRLQLCLQDWESSIETSQRYEAVGISLPLSATWRQSEMHIKYKRPVFLCHVI